MATLTVIMPWTPAQAGLRPTVSFAFGRLR